jgi:hypothetical protein
VRRSRNSNYLRKSRQIKDVGLDVRKLPNIVARQLGSQPLAFLRSVDLDTIAKCASAAINSPKNALMPDEYAQAQRPPRTYPSSLPLPQGPRALGPPPTTTPTPTTVVTIPDWHFMYEVEDLGFRDIVVLPIYDTTRPTGTIVSIVPAPGSSVTAATTVVEITTVRNTITDPIPSPR